MIDEIAKFSENKRVGKQIERRWMIDNMNVSIVMVYLFTSLVLLVLLLLVFFGQNEFWKNTKAYMVSVAIFATIATWVTVHVNANRAKKMLGRDL